MPYKRKPPTVSDIIGEPSEIKPDESSAEKALADKPVEEKVPEKEKDGPLESSKNKPEEPSAAPAQSLSEPREFGPRLDTQTYEVSGILDIMPEGHGFLRPKFIPSGRDIYISQSQIRRFLLRGGDKVEGLGRPPKDTERYFGLLKVEKVNGMPADESIQRPYFDDLTPIYPKTQITLATGKLPLSTRMIDLISPIGFGQRGMIVSPPKAGKTTILKELASGISQNFPKAHLMAALIASIGYRNPAQVKLI